MSCCLETGVGRLCCRQRRWWRCCRVAPPFAPEGGRCHHFLRAPTGSLISDTWTSSRQLTDQICTLFNLNDSHPMLCVCAVDCFVCPPFSACGLPPATTGVGNVAAGRHSGGGATWEPMHGPDQEVNLPATWSKAPFIVVPWVVERFDFRVLRQNRRITAGTEDRRADGWWTLCAPTRPVHT